MGVEPKIWENPQIIHLFIMGFPLLETIHFGYHYFWKHPYGSIERSMDQWMFVDVWMFFDVKAERCFFFLTQLF